MSFNLETLPDSTEITVTVKELKKIIKDKKEEEYKQLYFNVCEEKKHLQIENVRLKKDSEHWRKESGKFERMYKKQQMQKHYNRDIL